jgi:hypothetical protein
VSDQLLTALIRKAVPHARRPSTPPDLDFLWRILVLALSDGLQLVVHALQLELNSLDLSPDLMLLLPLKDLAGFESYGKEKRR